MEGSLYVEEYFEFEFDEKQQHIILANYTCDISGKGYMSESNQQTQINSKHNEIDRSGPSHADYDYKKSSGVPLSECS